MEARLRVRAVAALRVADASVMPQAASAKTGAPTMRSAERGAEVILCGE